MSEPMALDAALDIVATSHADPGQLRAIFERITSVCTRFVPGVDYASITVRPASGPLQTLAATSDLMSHADEEQYQLAEGPGYDAVTEDYLVHCGDLTRDLRWPTFGRRLRALGFFSLLAIRLIHPGEAVLALNLYSRSVDAFAEHPINSDLTERVLALRTEMEARMYIDHATGVLMERDGLDARQAFELLQEYAERRELPATAPEPQEPG